MPNPASVFPPAAQAPPRSPSKTSTADRIDTAAARMRNDLPLSSADVCALVGWSRRALLDAIARKTFPPPAVEASKAGTRTHLWTPGVIREHLAAMTRRTT